MFNMVMDFSGMGFWTRVRLAWAVLLGDVLQLQGNRNLVLEASEEVEPLSSTARSRLN